MPQRRILSLWLPRLAAERVLRREPALAEAPFAVVEETGGLLRLSALNGVAAGEGLSRGMPLTDARAICPALLTRPADPVAEGGMRAALLRWAGRFSPWVAEDAAGPGQAALVLDITGAAHLFGGEAALAEQVEGEAAALGLTARAAIADTRGAAWALARFAGAAPAAARSGDAIDQEAHATRVRAAKRRHWEKGGAAPAAQAGAARVPRIAAPGATRRALAPLPVAALRLEPAAVTQLTRLGLRRVEDLAGLPRGAVARRFGAGVLRRLDQALGAEPEPVSPARLAPRPAARLTLPEPVGLRSDIEAGLDRLLAALEPRLEAAGLGARRLRLTLTRVDGTAAHVELGLARPGRE
ncbi:MAG: DNA polymerase Y family protein, partial [Pseudomonadota bacterium]